MDKYVWAKLFIHSLKYLNGCFLDVHKKKILTSTYGHNHKSDISEYVPAIN